MLRKLSYPFPQVIKLQLLFLLFQKVNCDEHWLCLSGTFKSHTDNHIKEIACTAVVHHDMQFGKYNQALLKGTSYTLLVSERHIPHKQQQQQQTPMAL